MNDEGQHKEAFKSYKHNLILQASHNGECISKQMHPISCWRALVKCREGEYAH